MSVNELASKVEERCSDEILHVRREAKSGEKQLAISTLCL